MTAYWESLTLLQQILHFFAVPATLILVLQTIGSIFGLFGDEDLDLDTGTDTDVDTDLDMDSDTETPTFSIAGMKFFTIRGIIAFLSIFGWTGIVLLDQNLHTGIAIAIAAICGLIAMVVIAFIFYCISKLQYTGNMQLKHALNKTGEVYLTIPAKRAGEGKVNLMIFDRYSEVRAITDDENDIKTGAVVKVVEVIGNTLLKVSRY